MVSIRISNPVRALRVTSIRTPQAYRSFTASSRFQSQQGYGDGKGDPHAENPQEQPASSAAQEASEHPGPAPPDVGKGTGGGPTKAASKSPEDASASSGGARSKEATETGSSPTGGEIANSASQKGGEGLKGPQGEGTPSPKIYNQGVSGVKEGLSDEQKQEVERHNQDFEKGHDRGTSAPKDKVDSKFWKGTGGVQQGSSDARKGTETDWNA